MGEDPDAFFGLNGKVTAYGPRPDKPPPPTHRFKLERFDHITISAERNYLIKGLVPRVGLAVIWGPPKCGKSFWTFDLVMHVALGWPYRGRRVVQGAVVYCACEGADGFKARVEAWRKQNLAANDGPVPFYLMATPLDLIKDSKALIGATRAQLGEVVPVVVVIDTVNRSLNGSESKDEDMTRYVQAADALRAAFGCAVLLIHHCGVDATRPRGHTSLTAAADAQIAVVRNATGQILARLEYMKDGPEGGEIVSRLATVEIGHDADGDPITSCIVEPVEAAAPAQNDGPKLTANQQTMFAILHDAGSIGLSVDTWNDRAREAGIGTKRKATLYDIRRALKSKGLVTEFSGRWAVRHAD